VTGPGFDGRLGGTVTDPGPGADTPPPDAGGDVGADGTAGPSSESSSVGIGVGFGLAGALGVAVTSTGVD
jgi:hypothetical protein